MNGYGVLGQSIADAVVMQDDMQLFGVVEVARDWRIKMAIEKGFPVFASTQQATESMRAAGVQSIFRGGEKRSLTGHSFVAQANDATGLGRDSTPVVSRKTTSIVRALGALKNAGLLKKGRGVLIRRATDPWESDHSGVMNALVPETTIPSHQGPDAKTIIPDLNVMTVAVVAAHTTSHLHTWTLEHTGAATCGRQAWGRPA